MSLNNNGFVMPYGAYELKLTYQRNMLFGTLAAVSLAILVCAGIFLYHYFTPAEKIEETRDIFDGIIKIPPISIIRPPVQSPKGSGPPRNRSLVGTIPKPIEDDGNIDYDMQLPSQSELGEYVPGLPSDAGNGGSQGGGSDIEGGYITEYPEPHPDSFIAVEIEAEMVHEEFPDYPRLAKTAGLEGTVHVKALVDHDGNVAKAIVFISSGLEILDAAAVKAARECKFRPAIQNGLPVPVWVTFSYEFRLNIPY